MTSRMTPAAIAMRAIYQERWRGRHGRLGKSLRIVFHGANRCDKPVPSARQRFPDVARRIGVVAQRGPNLSNAEIHALVEVHERVAAHGSARRRV